MKEFAVKNVADQEQVKNAEYKMKRNRQVELEDLAFILQTEQGRRFLSRLLTHCSVFKSIWHPSAQIHHASGMQDVGHFLMAEIVEADEEAFLKIMTDSKGAKNVNSK
jgi:hypothetical protein